MKKIYKTIFLFVFLLLSQISWSQFTDNTVSQNQDPRWKEVQVIEQEIKQYVEKNISIFKYQKPKKYLLTIMMKKLN